MPARILVIEDDLGVRQLLSIYLEPMFTVQTAPDGIDGWRRFTEWEPDLVLTDLGLPGMNGLDLTKEIKQHQTLGDTPVVILTGSTRDEDLPESFWKMASGADAFLEKPVEAWRLRSVIDELLKKRINYQPLGAGKGYYD